MDVLLILGAVQCIFLMLVAMSKQPKDRAHRILMGMLLFWAFRFASYWYLTLYPDSPFLAYTLVLAQSTFLLDGPMMLIYLQALGEPERFRWHKQVGHFLPFAILFLFLAFRLSTFAEMPIQDLVSQRVEALRKPLLWQTTWEEKVLAFTVVGSLLVYTLVVLQKVRRFFRKDEPRMRNWKLGIIGAWLFCFILPMLLFLTAYATAFLPPRVLDYPLIYAFLMLIFLPAYQGISSNLRLPTPEPSPEEEPEEAPEKNAGRYQKSGLSEELAHSYQKKLEAYIQEEKPYLDAKLTLSSLAEALDMSSNHLSQILNEGLGQSFFDYINHYRVEAVKEKLRNPRFQHYTLLAIAQECGFKSKSSFNAVFKRLTGVPPSVYRDNGQQA